MKRKLLLIALLPAVVAEAQDSLFSAEYLVNEALQKNLQIQIVRNDREVARTQNNWGNAGKWPTVTASMGNTEAITNLNQELANGTSIKRDGATTNTLNANVVFNWRLYNGLRVRATKARLEELERIGEINVEQQVAGVIYDVLLNYYNIVRLNQQLKAINAIIALNEERTRIAKTRLDVGSAAKTDLLQAEIDLNTQKTILLGIETQIQQTKATLNNLLLRDPKTPFDVTDTAFILNTFDSAALAQSARTKNYDVLRARREMNVLIQQRREINANRIPTLSLNSVTNFNRQKASAGFFITNQTFGPNLGLNLAIPIYNSNITNTQLRVNKIQQMTQDLVIENLQNQVNTDLVTAYQEYENAIATFNIERENVKLAEENNFISTERFRKLVSNSIELRQAQFSLIDAQNRMINAEFRAKVAEMNIRLLAGELAGAF